ncbi:hypothetical protein GGP66_000657 [Salinibacter ruber]|uniref:Uncharacterized protein n=1 Tax=Salinibacter ruber TaxID=146919 RepID=A0A9X2ULQ5_9BACT|nr:hypothetical protein [Salinibacter ruber]MCS3673245.1 hypothetical protein [Salinibacter ruber]MCS4036989.1 hypothetical protein [Salinibacter ruber]
MRHAKNIFFRGQSRTDYGKAVVTDLPFVNALRNSTDWRGCRLSPRMRYGNFKKRNNRSFLPKPAPPS